jgi:hypothetical protein
MLKFYFDKRIPAGFFLALTILSWLVISSYLTIVKLINRNQITMYILNVLNNTGRVLVTTAIETRMYSLKKVMSELSRSSSGKVWTGPKSYEAATIFILQPYNNGKQQRSRDSSGGG